MARQAFLGTSRETFVHWALGLESAPSTLPDPISSDIRCRGPSIVDRLLISAYLEGSNPTPALVGGNVPLQTRSLADRSSTARRNPDNGSVVCVDWRFSRGLIGLHWVGPGEAEAGKWKKRGTDQTL